MTKISWDNVWETTITEFFNIIAFCREYNKKQMDMQEEYRKKITKR